MKAPGVFAAAVEDDLVMLDTRADTYLCVPDGVTGLGFDPARSTLWPADRATATAMVQSGLARATPSDDDRPPVPDLPSRGAAFLAPCRLSAGDVWRLAGCVLDLAIHYRGRSLPQILDYVAAQRRRLGPRSAAADRTMLVRRFHTAAIWLPDSRKCLVRSFLLLRFLQRSGADAQWVFGVRTWPFGAHCWLQADDTVLDDAPEQLLKYRPIRAA